MLPVSLRRWITVPCIGLGLIATVASAQTSPVATGKKFTYDDQTKESVFTGAAKLVYEDLVLTADEIRYNSEENRAAASGNVILTSGARRLIAERGTYNLSTKTLQVEALRFGNFPYYLEGESADGTIDEMTISNAKVFFREDTSFAPSVKAKKLTYNRGRIVSGEKISLGFLGGGLIQFRHLKQKIDIDFPHLNAQLGYRASLGALAEFGVQWPVVPGFRLGVDLGLYSARGAMIGPAGSYRRTTAVGSVDGFFHSGYIRDSGDRKNDLLGRPVPNDRSFLKWQHQQHIGDYLTLIGEFNYWRDSEIFRDFRSNQFTKNQQPDSYLEAAYTTDNTVLSAFARVHPNQYHRVQERLPEIRFDLLPVAAPAGLYHRFNSSLAVLREDAFGPDAQRRSNRLDAYYGLARPFAPTPWLSFSPVVGGRVTHYADMSGPRENFTRTIGEIGFDAQLRGSGTFDYKNPIWEVDGLRHLITPKLSYRYAPAADDGRGFIPPIDRRVFSTYLQPLSIGDSRNIDDLSALDTFRFEVANTLETRDPVYGSRTLAQLNVAADYRFSRDPGERPLSDIQTALSLTPARWLKLAVYQRFTLQDHLQQELNTAVEIVDQEWWSMRVSSHFLKNNYQEYSLEYRRRLNEVYEVIGRWRYDATLSRFNEQTYGLAQKLGQTWLIKYEVSFFQGPRRGSSFAFNVEVDLLKF